MILTWSLARTGVVGILLLIAGAVSAAAQPEQPMSLYSLDEAVERALRVSPTVEVLKAQLVAATAARRSAFGDFLPSLDVRGSWTRYLNDVGAVTGGTEIASSRPPTELTAGATLRLPLFDGFGRSSRFNERSHQLEALEHEEAALNAEIAWQTRVAFLSILASRTRSDALDAAIGFLRREVENLAVRIDAGVLPPFERDRLDAEIARLSHSLIVEENVAQMRLRTLADLLQLPAGFEFNVTSRGLQVGLDSAERASVAIELPPLAADAITSDPELLAANQRLESARARVDVARSGYYPNIGATAGYGLYNSGPISQSTATLGLDLTFRLFDGFSTDAAVAAAEADVVAARTEIETVRRRLTSERIAARDSFEAAERSVRSAESALEWATRLRAAAVERNKAGRVGSEDVLSSTRAQIEARVAFIDASIQWWIAYYDILRAEGLTYSPETP